MLLSIRQVLPFLLLASLIPSTTASPPPNSSYEPDLAAARRNAFRIFNTVHSAMRQWGSTINHNGVSFFLTIVPEGNLFYHGRPSPDQPDSFDWLAFEVEQAYGFAMSGMPPPHPPDPPDKPDMLNWRLSHSEVKKPQIPQTHELRFAEGSNTQHSLVSDDDGDKPNLPPPSRSYFQTYRATRQLKLIYIDGMSAGKGSWGTTDSQDLLITGLNRNLTNGPEFVDTLYGRILCSLAKEWGVDGWVRMETGFEVIYCDFSPGAGLEFVSQHGSAFPNETAGSGEWNIKMLLFEALRAASQRYDGVWKARIEVDWGSMVSIFTYDVNTTNPDLKRQDLPRLVGVMREEAEGIRGRLGEVVAARKDGGMPMVDWQAVVDDIVTRFSDRLHFIAHGNLSAEMLWGEIGTLVNPFLDYPADINASTPSPASILLCTRYYLDAALLRKDTWTPEDAAIFVALEVVADKICSSLFQIRSLLASTHDIDAALLRSRVAAGALMEQLQWTTWKQCGRCASSAQLCLIPIFPVGSVEDYYSPRCKGVEDMEESFKGCYWALGLPNSVLPMCANSGE